MPKNCGLNSDPFFERGRKLEQQYTHGSFISQNQTTLSKRRTLRLIQLLITSSMGVGSSDPIFCLTSFGPEKKPDKQIFHMVSATAMAAAPVSYTEQKG